MVRAKVSELTQALLRCAEKASNIARLIRADKEFSDKSLLDLLVEEKTGEQKNKKFLHDFKTLADVLIQETIRHELGKQYPELMDNIHGEESNTFTNILGEKIAVEVKPTKPETSKLLVKVLDGHQEAANALASEVHAPVTIEMDEDLSKLNVDVAIENIGIWVDPIDSTAQYIQGIENATPDSSGVFLTGLQCVTVLLGAFDATTGLPVIGVISQPFFCLDTDSKRWRSNTIWGISLGDVKMSSLRTMPSFENLPILTSRSESRDLKSQLSSDRKLLTPSGAGYKLLAVTHSLASAYVLTVNTIFKWDTCGAHAILLSLGGGIVQCDLLAERFPTNPNDLDLKNELSSLLEELQVRYHRSDCVEASGCNHWVNRGGIIAYRDPSFLTDIVAKLKALG